MDVRQLLSTMALEVETLSTPAEALERIAHYARVAVDADDSGILLAKGRGRIETLAATSGDVAKAHLLQGELDEGPCIDAIRGSDSRYVTGDCAKDPRWPRWGPVAADLGYRSIVSVRLATSGRIFGSLNSYAARPDAFSVADEEALEFLAAHASVAIAASQKAEELFRALDSRTVIGQAQGILMAIYDLDADGAFHYLRRLSMDSNTKLVDIATSVVAERRELRKQIT